MYKFGGVLLERHDREEGEFFVCIDLYGGSRDDHGTEGLVGLEEFADRGVGDGDEVRVEVFGVLEEELGIYNGGERFRGEVAAAKSIRMWFSCNVMLQTYALRRSAAARLVLV